MNCCKTLSISVTEPACGESTDWSSNPGACRLRVKDFNPVDWPLGGGCATCLASGNPAWDGTFPDFSAGEYHIASGVSVAGVQADVAYCRIVFFSGKWRINLTCVTGSGSSYLFIGQKVAAGGSPLGAYVKDFMGGCMPDPHPFEIEAYTP